MWSFREGELRGRGVWRCSEGVLKEEQIICMEVQRINVEVQRS